MREQTIGLDHSAVVDNVMSYRRLDPQKVAFDDKQGEKMLRTARLRVSGAQIVPFDPADPRAGCRCAAW